MRLVQYGLTDRSSGLRAALCCLFLTCSSNAALRDVREEVAKTSAQRLSKHHAPPPKHHWHPLQTAVTDQTAPPVPGGTGFGYYFNNSSLLWSNSTVMDYYILTPSTLGGISMNWLYLTTTCRSQLGTEALIGFYGEDTAQFMVFDWAKAATQPWQVDLELPTYYQQYLTVRWDEFGNRRQMCHVRNGTYYLGASGGAYNWRNEVLLYNFALEDWDQVYSYDYTTASLGVNLYQSGAGGGWWGPIVETFGSYTNTHAIGFDLVRLFQDGKTNSVWLASANCFLQSSSAFLPISVAPNRSFAVYGGPANPDTTAFPVGRITKASAAGEVLLRVDSLPAREYRAYEGLFVGRSWEWFPIGSPMVGTGDPIDLHVPAVLPSGLFRVATTPKTSTLTVVVDNPNASFTLNPPAGTVGSPWITQPISNRWDKVMIGIPPGAYSVSFSALGGGPAPPTQNVTIPNNGIGSVFGLFGGQSQ